MRTLTSRNVVLHRPHNRLTAISISVGVSMVVFISSVVNAQLLSMDITQMQVAGSPITLPLDLSASDPRVACLTSVLANNSDIIEASAWRDFEPNIPLRTPPAYSRWSKQTSNRRRSNPQLLLATGHTSSTRWLSRRRISPSLRRSRRGSRRSCCVGMCCPTIVRPDRDKSDHRRQLADALKAEIADGVQRALKSKTGTIIGVQCYKTASRVFFRDCIVYPVLFLKYIGSGQKDYIVIWTRDGKALDDGSLRGLTRLSDDSNFARLKVDVFVAEAVHSSGDDLPTQELDDLEKKASELLKVSAMAATDTGAPDSPEKEVEEKPEKPKKAAAKRSRRSSRKEPAREDESLEEASPPRAQRAARETAHLEQQLRAQGDKIIKELHDVHKEIKGGFEHVAGAIDGLADTLRTRAASRAPPAPLGTYMPPLIAPPPPAYTAPAPQPPAAAEMHHHHRSSERPPASPHRRASEEDLDEMLRMLTKRMKARDSAARRETVYD